jgi:hypothetical protein
MDKPIDNYWQTRLKEAKSALEANSFDVFLAEDLASAKKIVLEQILPLSGQKAFPGVAP